MQNLWSFKWIGRNTESFVCCDFWCHLGYVFPSLVSLNVQFKHCNVPLRGRPVSNDEPTTWLNKWWFCQTISCFQDLKVKRQDENHFWVSLSLCDWEKTQRIIRARSDNKWPIRWLKRQTIVLIGWTLYWREKYSNLNLSFNFLLYLWCLADAVIQREDQENKSADVITPSSERHRETKTRASHQQYNITAPPTFSDWQVISGKRSADTPRRRWRQKPMTSWWKRMDECSHLFDSLVVLVAPQFLLLGRRFLCCRLQDAEGKTAYAVLSGNVATLYTLDHKSNYYIDTVYVLWSRTHIRDPSGTLHYVNTELFDLHHLNSMYLRPF